MIRILLEFQIQRYLDDGAPLPGWLALLVRHDRKLQKLVEEFHALDDALLLSAAARRHSLTAQSDAASPIVSFARKPTAVRQRPRLQWVYVCAAAAAASLVTALTISSQQRQAEADQIQTLSRQFTEMPRDMGGLLTRVADSSQSRLSRYAPTKVFTERDYSTWRATATHAIEPLDRQAKAVNTWFSKYSELSDRLRAQFQKDRSRLKST